MARARGVEVEAREERKAVKMIEVWWGGEWVKAGDFAVVAEGKAVHAEVIDRTGRKVCVAFVNRKRSAPQWRKCE